MKRPEYDGDNDGFITNPLTGEDDIPWNKAKETAEEAIAKFFGGKVPERRETIGEAVERAQRRMRPIDGSGRLKPEDLDLPALPRSRPTDGSGRPKPADLADNDLPELTGRVSDEARRYLADPNFKPREVPIYRGAEPGGKPAAAPGGKPAAAPGGKKPQKPTVGNIVQSPSEAGTPGVRPPLPAPTAPQPQPSIADNPWTWPRNADGKMKELGELSDQELDEALGYWKSLNEENQQRAVSSPPVIKLIADIEQEQTKRRRAAEAAESEARSSLWDRFSKWFPSSRWKYPRDSHFYYGAESHGRLRGEMGVLEVIEADAVLPGEDGFIVIGEIYDPDSDEFIGYDSSDTPSRSVEDAMKYAEDILDALDRGDDSVDAFDPDNRPNPNQISEESSLPTTRPWQLPNPNNKPAKGKDGPLGEKARTHGPIPRMLEDARKLFAEKWQDRRRNENLQENIQFADDRITELRLLNERMWDQAMQDFRGLEEAWNMSADDFARWAKRNRLVDSLSEGRDYHEELMALWDQLALDQEEIGGMIAEIDAAKTRFISQWNERNEAGNPNFPYSWADSGLARYHF